MPTHKVANDFIRKYNKEFAIKGYSKMKIHEKLKLIEAKLTNAPRRMKHIKKEWNDIKGSYHKSSPTPDPKKKYVKKKWTIEDVAKKIKNKKPMVEHTLALKGPSTIKMTTKPPSSTMKISGAKTAPKIKVRLLKPGIHFGTITFGPLKKGYYIREHGARVNVAYRKVSGTGIVDKYDKGLHSGYVYREGDEDPYEYAVKHNFTKYEQTNDNFNTIMDLKHPNWLKNAGGGGQHSTGVKPR